MAHLLYLLGVFSLILCISGEKSDFLVVYARGDHTLVVKDVDSRRTLKTFTIQVEKPTGGICVDYKRDALFYAHKDTIYRITLVDQNGNRKVSGEGELFTNKMADHHEIASNYPTWNRVGSITCDEHSGNIYYIHQDNISDKDSIGFEYEQKEYRYKYVEYDTESMKDHRYSPEFSLDTSYHFNFLLQNDTLYAFSVLNICTATLNEVLRDGIWHCHCDPHSFCLFSSNPPRTIDPTTNRLFHCAATNQLNVHNVNLLEKTLNTTEDRIVMADSQFVMDVSSLAVHDDIVVWTSRSWNKTYVGKLNKNKVSMSRQNVHELDTSYYGQVDESSQNIVIVDVRGSIKKLSKYDQIIPKVITKRDLDT